jgi:UDP-N-acetylmuramoyl-tripeptide--D-alanyl-D-alanine ligase
MISALTWQSENVVKAVSGKPSGAQNWQATGVSIDSRTIQPGDLFIALKGPAHDGHDYVANALKAGAVAAIVSRQPKDAPQNAPLIIVKDTMKALEDLGHAGRARAKAKIIAVTGSVGKTGTKEMLRLMLGAEAYANEGSFNNQWGVPLSLARLPAEAKFGVFELGMNHAGELGPLSKQVQPHVALITNVEPVHLEFFPSVEAIADAKAEIFLGMNADGIAVLNRDNPHLKRLDDAACKQNLKRIVSFGRGTLAEARLVECTNTADGSEIKADILGHPIAYRLSAAGEHLALNSLGALLAAAMAGADIDAAAAALTPYHPPKGRGVTQKLFIPGGTITLIDESYNASPPSVRAAISVLGRMTPASGGRLIMALGDMRELGPESPILHATLAHDLIEAKITRVYCCGPMMKHLFEALPPALRGFQAEDSASLAPHLAADLKAGDIVSVKGSNAMHMNRVIEAIKALDASPQQKSAGR